MSDPTKPTPRTSPVATGTIVLAASAMLTLAACNPTTSAPAESRPITTTSAPVAPVAGGISAPPANWRSSTQPASQPTTLRSADYYPLAGDVIDTRPQWPTTQPAKTYTVKPGDTLTSIARQHNTTVAALKKANPTINPDKIRPTQKLNLP